MTDEEFKNRYEIVSLSGRYYSRKMLLDRAQRIWGIMVKRADLAAVIDDDAWLITHRGEVPQAVAIEAGLKALGARVAPEKGA